jgi:hypothetical protein
LGDAGLVFVDAVFVMEAFVFEFESFVLEGVACILEVVVFEGVDLLSEGTDFVWGELHFSPENVTFLTEDMRQELLAGSKLFFDDEGERVRRDGMFVSGSITEGMLLLLVLAKAMSDDNFMLIMNWIDVFLIVNIEVLMDSKQDEIVVPWR